MRLTPICLLTVLGLGSAVPAQLECRVYTTDRIIRVRLPRGEWFAPEQVQRIEVNTSRAARPRDVLEAWAGPQAWPFSLDPHKDVQVIEVDERVRKSWLEHGVLTVGFATQRDSGGELILRAGLRRLDLPADGVEVTLGQRRTIDIEGTDGYLYLHIDDITAGQVRLDIRGAEGKTLIRPRSVREGDRVALELGEGKYILVVKRLVNLLIGDDYGVFAIYERGPFERQRIEALLRHVEAATVVFIHEGVEYDGAEAAAHLRRKYAPAQDEIQTLEQFIQEIGSRSSTTGRPYQVKVPSGAIMPADEWLRQQAAELEKKQVGGKDKGA